MILLTGRHRLRVVCIVSVVGVCIIYSGCIVDIALTFDFINAVGDSLLY